MSGRRRLVPLTLALLVSIAAHAAGEEARVPPIPIGGLPQPDVPCTAPPGAAPARIPAVGPMSEPVDPPAPVVTLRVRVPASAGGSAELTYRIIIQNTSQASAHHVRVRNPLPANVRFVRAVPEPVRGKPEMEPELVWDFGTLPPHAEREITLVVKPSGTGEIRNCARVSFEHGEWVTTRIDGSSPIPASTPALRPIAPVAPLEQGKPDLQIRLIGPPRAIAEVGPATDFITEVTNAGEGVARGVVVTNTYPGDLQFSNSRPSVSGDKNGLVTWSLGDIEPHQRRQVLCTVLPKTAGAFTVKASVRDVAGQTKETSSAVHVVEPKLSIVTTGPKSRLINRPATYQIVVSNPGSMPAANVVVISEVTEGMTLKSVSAGGLLSANRKRFDKKLGRDVTYQEIRWAIGSLEERGHRNLEMVLQTTNAGTLEHRVWAQAERGLTARSDCVTDFEAATGLTLEIEPSANPIEVGGKMSYTINVVNQGDAPAKNLGVTVTLPPEMELVRDRLDASTHVEGQKVTFAKLVALAARTPGRFVVEVKAVKPGTAKLRVELTGDMLPKGTLTQEETTTIYGDEAPK